MEKDYVLETINLELTTACPLRCPQCYCTLEGGQHLKPEIAKRRIDEAAQLGAKILLLSGGETLCYPYLNDIIQYAKNKIPQIKVALSGVGFDQVAYEGLIKSGVTEISISLNGSTEQVNSLTRDGYSYAIRALKLLQENGYPNTVINWVMHSNNADDFPNLVSLAEEYLVMGILIIGVKPDSHNALHTLPTREQMENVSSFIKRYNGKLKLMIESCYSNMLAYHADTKLFGNLNVTKWKGCGAGRNGISVNVDGELTPCRHLLEVEGIERMEDYWRESSLIAKLRDIEMDTREPCTTCAYMRYCRHCAAINLQLNGEVYIGFEQCPMYKVC